MFLVAGAGPAICTQTPAENQQKHNCPATLTTTKQTTTKGRKKESDVKTGNQQSSIIALTQEIRADFFFHPKSLFVIIK